MKKFFLIAASLQILIINTVFAQDQPSESPRKSVYRTKWYIDGPIILGGLISNYYGVRVLKGKKGLDSTTVINLSPEDIPRFDRGAAKQDPDVAENSMFLSDVALTTTIVLPGLLILNKQVRSDALNIGIVYLTTMSVMANCYSWGVGHINRYRPYVYNPEEDMKRRTRRGSRNSFYGGHAAAAATAAFFGAKVFADYNPGSKAIPYLYAAAAIPPIVVGYYRYRSGMHFPSDIIVGSIAGAALGIIIPELHKPRHKKISIGPSMYGEGLGITYKLD